MITVGEATVFSGPSLVGFAKNYRRLRVRQGRLPRPLATSSEFADFGGWTDRSFSHS